MKVPARKINEEDAAIVKALLARKVAQHDIASFVGCHPTLISDINRGRRFAAVPAASLADAAVMRRLIEGLAGWNARVSRVIHEAVTTAEAPQGRIV